MRALSRILKLTTLTFSMSLLIPLNMVAQEENSLVKMAEDPALKWGPCPEFMPEGCKLAILHGDPAKNNADIFIRFDANSEIANHYHTSPERMILVAGEMEVTYEGEEPQNLNAGAYAYGPALKHHSARCGDIPCLLFVAFEDPVDAIPVKN